MKKKYYAVINPKDFGVIFPDFLGCVSVGDNLDDATIKAQEVLEFHIQGMREDGEELPEPTALEQVKKEYPDNVFKYQQIFIK
jgi:predicted RNase H-like HicB family nuclease